MPSLRIEALNWWRLWTIQIHPGISMAKKATKHEMPRTWRDSINSTTLQETALLLVLEWSIRSIGLGSTIVGIVKTLSKKRHHSSGKQKG